MAPCPLQAVISRSTSSMWRAKSEPAGEPAADDGPAQHPAAHRGGQHEQGGDVEGSGVVEDRALRVGGPGVQGVGVVAGELGGTGERLDDAFAERLLQCGQPLVAEP